MKLVLAGDTTSLFPPDWSQMVPDAILTVLVGTVLAVAFYKWQTGQEDKSERRVALSSWNVSRSFVSLGMEREWDSLSNRDNFDLYSNQLHPFLEKARTLNVGPWAEAAPGDAELKLVAHLLVDGPNFQRLGREVRARLQEVLRESGQVAESGVQQYVNYLTLRILGSEDALRDMTGQEGPDHMAQIGEMVLTDARLMNMLETYTALHGRIRQNYTHLRNLLLITTGNGWEPAL